jgi:hypothetical protein
MKDKLKKFITKAEKYNSLSRTIGCYCAYISGQLAYESFELTRGTKDYLELYLIPGVKMLEASINQPIDPDCCCGFLSGSCH